MTVPSWVFLRYRNSSFQATGGLITVWPILDLYKSRIAIICYFFSYSPPVDSWFWMGKQLYFSIRFVTFIFWILSLKKRRNQLFLKKLSNFYSYLLLMVCKIIVIFLWINIYSFPNPGFPKILFLLKKRRNQLFLNKYALLLILK